MKLKLVLSMILASLAFALTAPAASATSDFKVQEDGAHCTIQNGPHFAWDVIISPGHLATTWTVSQPWTVQNVTGPTAADRLVLHLVSSSPVSATSYVVSVNGIPYPLTPTISQGPGTLNGQSENCPQPEVTTTTTTQPETPTTTTTQAQETTTTTTATSTTDPLPGPTPSQPQLGTALVISRASSPQPVVLATSRDSMPMTGSRLLALLFSAGVALSIVGLTMASRSKTKRGLNR